MAWVYLILISVVPTLVACALLSLVTPPDEPPPRWRTVLAGWLTGLAQRLRREDPEPVDPPSDPFRTLRLQQRLGVVAGHVRRLEDDEHTFARAERIIASQLAYDDLLAEACRMAGVEVRATAPGDPQERFRKEVELAARGWTW